MAAKLAVSHEWNLPIPEARALQAELARKVVVETTFLPGAVRAVAGVDVGYREGLARAAVVVLSYPGLELLDYAVAQEPVHFPYVPGLLAFREGPAVVRALDGLATWPDLFLFDAQGLAHPRRLGLASHLGVVLDAPSIGCAKSRLAGHYDEPGDAPGSWCPLVDGGEVIGAAVRTQAGAKPLFISIGHRVDLATAIEFVLRCVRGHRLPETTRAAHRLAGGAAPAAVQPRGPSRCA